MINPVIGLQIKKSRVRHAFGNAAYSRQMGEDVFVHSMDLVHSTYLMVNKNNADPDSFIEKARLMFDDIFPALSDF